jgi:hypothetical protein
MDEGSVSICYTKLSDLTQLLVCGSMNDYFVLSRISSILGAPIVSSAVGTSTRLPNGAVRVQSARAYALLRLIRPHLIGLKAAEADAALEFFPRSGVVRGRHTTDEFLTHVWREHALNTMMEWNSRRRVKITQAKMSERVANWVEGRVRRARRFIDEPKKSLQSASVVLS